MTVKSYIITTVMSAISTIVALMLCIYALATSKYWIPVLMLVVGIMGVITTAYVRTRKHHERRLPWSSRKTSRQMR